MFGKNERTIVERTYTLLKTTYSKNWEEHHLDEMTQVDAVEYLYRQFGLVVNAAMISKVRKELKHPTAKRKRRDQLPLNIDNARGYSGRATLHGDMGLYPNGTGDTNIDRRPLSPDEGSSDSTSIILSKEEIDSLLKDTTTIKEARLRIATLLHGKLKTQLNDENDRS